MTTATAELLVRPAIPADLPAVLDLQAAAATAAYAPLGDKAVARWLEIRNTPAWLHQRFTHPHGVLHVAERAGQLEGSGFVRFDGEQAFLGDLCVRSPGHGVGSAVLAVRLELARQWGCRSVWCLAFAAQAPGLRFLHRHGFVVSGVTESDVLPGALMFRHELSLWPARPALPQQQRS